MGRLSRSGRHGLWCRVAIRRRARALPIGTTAALERTVALTNESFGANGNLAVADFMENPAVSILDAQRELARRRGGEVLNEHPAIRRDGVKVGRLFQP